MALTVTLANTGSQNGTASTIAVTLGIAFAKDDVLVALVACDNGGTSGARSLSTTATLSGETVTNRRANNHDPGIARAGTTLGIWTSVMGASKTGTETITFDKASADYISVILWKVSSDTVAEQGGVVYGTVGGNAGADAATTTVTTGTINVGDVVIGCTAYEGNTAVTSDTDSSNGSWSAQTTKLADSGTALTSMTCASQYKIQTTTASTQTYDTAFTSSSVQAGYVTFSEPILSYPPIRKLMVNQHAINRAANW